MTVSECMNQIIVPTLLKVFEIVKILFDYFGAWSWIFGAFCIYTIYRFLLKPLLGGRAIGDSDTTKRNSKNDEQLGVSTAEE